MTCPFVENSDFCFSRISILRETKSRETLRFSGNKIQCSIGVISVKCLHVKVYLKIARKIRRKEKIGWGGHSPTE